MKYPLTLTYLVALRGAEATNEPLSVTAERLHLDRNRLSELRSFLRLASAELVSKAEQGDVSLSSMRRYIAGKALELQTVDEKRQRRLQVIKRMAERGHHSEDIAQKVGLHPETVRRYLRAAGVRIPDITRPTRIDSDQVLTSTVDSLSGLVAGIDAVDVGNISSDVARALIPELERALQRLKELYTELTKVHKEEG